MNRERYHKNMADETGKDEPQGGDQPLVKDTPPPGPLSKHRAVPLDAEKRFIAEEIRVRDATKPKEDVPNIVKNQNKFKNLVPTTSEEPPNKSVADVVDQPLTKEKWNPAKTVLDAMAGPRPNVKPEEKLAPEDKRSELNPLDTLDTLDTSQLRDREFAERMKAQMRPREREKNVKNYYIGKDGKDYDSLQALDAANDDWTKRQKAEKDKDEVQSFEKQISDKEIFPPTMTDIERTQREGYKIALTSERPKTPKTSK